MAEIKLTEAQESAIYADGCSLAISAAAGSGKTFVLTSRIIDRIKTGKADISRMLIVTFTRAAAAKLKNDISDGLTELCAENISDKRLAGQLLTLPSAKICTIDGFCFDIIKEYLTDTGVSGFSVCDPEEEKMIMNDVMDELTSDYFDGNVPETAKIEDFGKFYDTIGSPSSSGEFCRNAADIYKTYATCVNRNEAILGKESDGEWYEKLKKTLKAAFGYYGGIYADALDDINSNAGASGWKTGFETDKAFIDEFIAALNGNADYTRMKALAWDYENRKTKKLGSVKEKDKTPELSYFQEKRNKFIKYITDVKNKYFGLDEETINEAYAETLKIRKQTCVFLDEFERRFTAEKKRRRMMSFNDIERITFEFLYDESTGGQSDAAKEIADKFDDIYIDEYQDTNELQDMIFSLISREDNRFIVGDIKQSIYYFRGAEPSLFNGYIDALEKYPAGNAKKAKLFLSENFRSSSAVIDFVNSVFDTVMNDETRIGYGEDEKLNCGRPELERKPVELDFVCKNGSEEVTEAKYVAARIADMIESGEAKPDDIAVLMRSGHIGIAVEEELKALGIACKNEATDEYFANDEILLAVSLLHTVDNPSRDVYLAGTLKSPIYGVTLDELMFIRKSKEGGTLYSALKEFTEKTGFKKGRRFLSDHEKFRRYSKVMNCAETVRRIFADTQIMSLASMGKTAAEAENSRANLQKFYDCARNYEKGGDRRLYGFVKYIDELSEGKSKVDVSQFSKSTDTVKLMTIHKSKGLQFKVCFLCNVVSTFNDSDVKSNVICTRSAPLATRIIKNGVRLDTPMRELTIDGFLNVLTEEEIRVLYVALTRAKEKLIITSEVKDEPSARQKYDFSCRSSECSMAIKYFSQFARKKATSYAELICLAMSKTPRLCELNFIDSVERVSAVSDDEPLTNDVPLAETKREINKRIEFEYPYKILSGVPSKLSVSKLYPDVLDEKDDSAPLDEAELTVGTPNFLRENAEEADAAEKGTAMHTFMQFFDFENVDANGVKAEIRRLADKKLIFAGDAELLDEEKLQNFFDSHIAGQMRRARGIYREKRFLVYYPAERFSEDDNVKRALSGEKLLVQGVIDCAFINSEGELILVDYKTDSFDDVSDRRYISNILKKRHRRQLEYYKYACEKLFGQRVAHTYIYSFALDDCVEL